MNIPLILDRSQAIPGTLIPGRWGYRRMTHREYIEFPAVSRSLLDWPTMSQMFHYAMKENEPSTHAQDLGTLVHIAMLEPHEAAGTRFVAENLPLTPSGKPSESREAKEAWREARARNAVTNPGKIVVTVQLFESMVEELRTLRLALQANPDAMRILDPANADFEVTGIFWHETWGCWVKFRPDILPKHREEGWGYCLGDVKSTRRAATERDFRSDCYEFGYFMQDVFYSHCHEQMLPPALRGVGAFSVGHFANIVLSKPDPKEFRESECRVFMTPMDESVNKDLEGAHAALFPTDGLGRAEKFVACLREYVSQDPHPDPPTEWLRLRRIWPMHEDLPRAIMLR